MNETIVYEQPLNERIRTFMRLEHLFSQAAYTLRGFSVWDSRATISSLLNILETLSRGEIKSELIKELEHMESYLTGLMGHQGVDESQLSSVLEQVSNSLQNIHHYDGTFGQTLRDNELLASIRQRASIIGGDCRFDLPLYHFWLKQNADRRIATLESWFDQLQVVNLPVTLILNMLRESATPSAAVAESGFFQQTLDSEQSVKLIRVTVTNGMPYYAEISGGKHRFTIRFLEPRDSGRPMQTQDDVNFDLSYCFL